MDSKYRDNDKDRGRYKVTPVPLDKWIRKYKTKPEICPGCGKQVRLELRSISGKYLRDINDYEYLCRKCHIMKYHSKG